MALVMTRSLYHGLANVAQAQVGWTISQPSASAEVAVNAYPSRGQVQPQCGHSQEQEPDRQAELRRIVARAQVGVEGTDEEQDEANCGRCSDQGHADDAEQQSDRARCFEGAYREG